MKADYRQSVDDTFRLIALDELRGPVETIATLATADSKLGT